MAHVMKDLFTGGVLVAAGLVAAGAALIVFFIIGLFLHIFAALASVVFCAALLVFAVWLVGFAYRRLKETRKR